MSKPSIPQGTRDFSPAEVRKRQYIFNTLKNIFELYGFQPLETPAMENIETLTGKYGDEGDKLIFRILDSGNPYSLKFFKELFASLKDYNERTKDFLHSQRVYVPGPLDDLTLLNVNPTVFYAWVDELLRSKDLSNIKSKSSGKALRYDLTIPFARFVVMRQNDIAFPFRRYQMQPVWRADRPQKGRYREFWQCDCDVVGSTSLINEAELLSIYREAFHQLKLPQVTVKINSRKILAGLSELCGTPEKMMDITIALDKLDKIGWDGVTKELQERGVNDAGIQTVEKIINVSGSNMEKLTQLKNIMSGSETALAGIAELEQSIAYHEAISNKNWTSELAVDISLARGLNYYTGVIVEVATNAVKMGSIGGGGRYDDLTGLFGLKNMSGVGVSFGIDRIYDVLEELNLFPQELETGSKVLLLNFGGENEAYALSILQQLRNAGIAAEIYPDAAKFDKQMKYANKRNFQYVIIPGDDERATGKLSLKNFETGKQEMLGIDEAISVLRG